MAGGTGLSGAGARAARPLLRRRHRRAARELLFAAGLALEGMKPVVRDLLHVPPACVRPDHPRRVPAAAERGVPRWTAPAWSATTGLRITAPTTSPTCGALPNMVVMAPRDEAMLVADAAHRASRKRTARSRCAIRAAQAVGVPLPEAPRRDPRLARGETLSRGRAGRVRRIGDGGSGLRSTRPRCCAQRGVNPTVCDARFAKPLDRELLHSLDGRATTLLVTVEENVLAGGFGSAVIEHLSDSRPRCPAPRGHPVRPAGPLRHARQAGAPA